MSEITRAEIAKLLGINLEALRTRLNHRYKNMPPHKLVTDRAGLRCVYNKSDVLAFFESIGESLEQPAKQKKPTMKDFICGLFDPPHLKALHKKPKKIKPVTYRVNLTGEW
jgi:hypothetical protein